MMAKRTARGRAMGDMTIERMDADTFLDWCTRQEGRYELVDGVPRMMVGARKAHDRAVRHGLSALDRKLRGGPCEPFTEAIGVRIPDGNVRRPDILVDCGRGDPDLLHADKPVLVVEVLSPTNRQADLIHKVAEYQRVPSIAHILLVAPDEPAGLLHTRGDGDTWSMQALIGPDAPIALPALGISLALSDFYE
ncbi:Uma2 family endonuclease [Chthonobacter rhizosphaerae]|uniref:Uma2 family endonuclease n=1 Tax=Chthonobacter rhizosphaerae TaxID=2735553 RepID=UPI001AEF0794|nr:Uma2 family endonuclease [Chthonobacter rhizosphaerae]